MYIYILQIMPLNIHVVCTIYREETYQQLLYDMINFDEIHSLGPMPFPHMHKEIRCEKGWGKESRGIARGGSGGSSIPFVYVHTS